MSRIAYCTTRWDVIRALSRGFKVIDDTHVKEEPPPSALSYDQRMSLIAHYRERKRILEDHMRRIGKNLQYGDPSQIFESEDIYEDYMEVFRALAALTGKVLKTRAIGPSYTSGVRHG